MSLEEVEAYLIKKALARADGNARQAAEALGIESERVLSAVAALWAVMVAAAAVWIAERLQGTSLLPPVNGGLHRA